MAHTPQQSTHKQFANRLRKQANGSLRWNQHDVIDTVAKFLVTKKGTAFSELGKDVPESELQTKRTELNAAMIESSPGSGKTRIMGTLAKIAAKLDAPERDKSEPIKVLYLTPRLDLNRQTLHELDEELGVKDKDVAVFDSHQSLVQKRRAKDAPVLVGTYQSLPKMLQEGVISLDPKSPQYRGLVLMDEAHELQDFSYVPKPGATPINIASFVNDHQMTFLFTGTDDGVSQRHFGAKVPTIYSKRLVKAHNEGLTCEHIHPGLVDIGVKTRDWQEHIAEAKKDVGEHHQELLEYFSGHPKVIEAAVETQLTAKEPYMGPLNRYKSIFFVDGKKAGEDGAAYYNKRAKELGLKNLKAANINADTSKEDRKQILRDYKAGKITAIFNDRILTFGFDDRETAVIHDLKMHDRNARALARMEQIFTRGTRKCEWFKRDYGIEKQALLLSYRPIGPDGEPVNLLTAADLLQGLQIKPRELGLGEGWGTNGGGDKEKKKKPRPELSNEFDVHIHFDFGEQMQIADIMRQAHEAALRAVEAQKKPNDTWSMEEFSQKLGGRDGRGIVGRLREQFSQEPGLQEITYRNINVPRDAFVSYIGDNGKPAWGIKIAVGQEIIDSYPKLSLKPDNVWSSVELGVAMGLKSDSNVMKKLKEYFDANVDAKVNTMFGIKIPRSALVEYDLRGDVITGIKVEYGQRIVAAYKQSLDDSSKPGNVWSSSQLAREMDVSIGTAGDVIKALQEDFSKSEAATIDYRGVTVPRTAIVAYEYNKLPAVGITQAVGKKIAVAYNKKKGDMRSKPDDVWSSVELARKLGSDDTAGYSIIAGLVKQVEENPKLKLLKYRTAKIPRDAIVTYDSEVGKRTGIKQDAGQLIIQAQQDKKDKPDDVWSSKDFDKALKSESGIGTGIIAMIRKQFNDESCSNAKVKGVEIPRTAWIEYEYNGRPAFGVQQEYAVKLLAAYGLQSDDIPTSKEKDTSESSAIAKITKKSIKPDSPDLKRTGRSRGKGED